MKAFLKFLFFVLFLVLLIIVTGLFLPKNIRLVINKHIEAPEDIIFEEINNLSKWKNWSPWLISDSAMKFYILGKEYGEGAEFKWESEPYGNCNGKITHIKKDESVGLTFNFGTKSRLNSFIHIEPIDNGCILNWNLSFSDLEFWERYFAILNKNKIKQLIKTGIDSLKIVSEDLKYSRIGRIEIVDIPESIAVIKIDTVSVKNEDKKLRELDDYLNYFFTRRKITPVGKPFKLCYETVNDTLQKIGYGYTLSENTWIWKTLEKHSFTNKAISVSHYGGINTKKAHQAINKFITENRYEINGIPWEVRMFNDSTDIDSSLWEIKIFYPISFDSISQ